MSFYLYFVRHLFKNALCKQLCLVIGIVVFVMCQPQQSGQSAPKTPLAPLPDTLTIMSYNVENLFDMVDDGTEYPEFKPNTHNWNDYTLGIKLHNIASVIVNSDADIVALMEIENQQVLELLKAETRRLGGNYPTAVAAGKDGRSATTTALLSRYPLASSRDFESVKTPHSSFRNILEAHFVRETDTLILFINHWPSRKHPESLRVQAARSLALRLRELSANTDYIVLGDFNESLEDKQRQKETALDDVHGLLALEELLIPGSFQSKTSLSSLRERARSCTGICLYDCWFDLPAHQRWNYIYKGEYNNLDHMLLPPAFFDAHGYSYLDRSFGTFTNNDSLLVHGIPNRWRMRYTTGPSGEHLGKGYSDHLPIRARFYRGPFKSAATDTSPYAHDPATRSRAATQRGDFEAGLDGWLCPLDSFTLSSDTTSAFAGKKSLHIQGTTGTANVTIAKAFLLPSKTTTAPLETLTFYIRGTAPLCFRLRSPLNKKWKYFSGPRYTPRGTAQYHMLHASQWQKISLPIAAANINASGAIFEIRGGKESMVNLYIDALAMY